ncbi:transposase [Bradyrhizobium sp. USDA 4486]
MQVVRIGLDLAKYVFEVHGVDNHGKVVVRKRLRRDAVAGFFANLPACLVGMEASNGAHYWARVLTALGHQVRLISPQFVTPYVKSNKNDQNDAEAICEAVGRPSMRFVPPNQPISWRYRLSTAFADAWSPTGSGSPTRFAVFCPSMALSLPVTSRSCGAASLSS